LRRERDGIAGTAHPRLGLPQVAPDRCARQRGQQRLGGGERRAHDGDRLPQELDQRRRRRQRARQRRQAGYQRRGDGLRAFVAHYCSARSAVPWDDEPLPEGELGNDRHILARGSTHLPSALPWFGSVAAA